MFLHQFPVSPLPSTAPLSVGSRHTDICLEAINSAANMEFHTHTHRSKSKSLKETSKKKIEKDRFWLISLRLSGLLSIKFVYWFLPVCRQDMWSFMFMAHWASFHMKPMTCLLEKTRAPSAVSSLRPYLSPKILGERILRLWTKKTVLLMLHIHKVTLGLTWSRFQGLEHLEKLTVILASIHFSTWRSRKHVQPESE